MGTSIICWMVRSTMSSAACGMDTSMGMEPSINLFPGALDERRFTHAGDQGDDGPRSDTPITSNECTTNAYTFLASKTPNGTPG